VSQVAALDDIWNDNASTWSDVKIIIINAPGYETSLLDMAAGTNLTVLQDDNTTSATEQYGAARAYLYIIGKDGKPINVHYALDIEEDEEQRFIDEVNNARMGGK
jgi:hypothetical protein